MRLISNKDCWMSIMFAFPHCQLASFVCWVLIRVCFLTLPPWGHNVFLVINKHNFLAQTCLLAYLSWLPPGGVFVPSGLSSFNLDGCSTFDWPSSVSRGGSGVTALSTGCGVSTGEDGVGAGAGGGGEGIASPSSSMMARQTNLKRNNIKATWILNLTTII